MTKQKKYDGALSALEQELQNRVAELEKKFGAAQQLVKALQKRPREYTQEEIRQINELRKGLIPPDATAHDINFMQTIGDVTPLCWIPVPDIQAVVKLLLEHMPDSICRLKRAQFQAVISSLNEYVGEALDRNAKKTTTYVATWSDTSDTDEAEPKSKKK